MLLLGSALIIQARAKMRLLLMDLRRPQRWASLALESLSGCVL